jgi:hypothetical protein
MIRIVKTIRANKDDHRLKNMGDFLLSFKHATVQEREEHIQNFRSGLLRLRDGFATIYEREEVQRVGEFKMAFHGLISAVKEARERGVWRKTYFNLFATLGYQRIEEAHSNILAWLLNPEEAHGLGDAFLRAFVKRVFNKELPVYFPVKIMRERQEGEDRPDIVVEGNNWWLVIENKIGSTEQKKQTLRYAKRWGVRGKIGENVFFAFLNPSGWSPESGDFYPVSYRIIRELLESMHFQGDSNFLIRHFIDHILLNLEG